MKLNKLFLVGVAIVALVFTNCNTSEDGSSDNSLFSFGNTITSDFAGKVVDSNNNPISGVAITMSGQTTTTDASGNFTLSSISVKENFGYLTATKNGFINGSRTVVPHDGVNNIKIMLLEKNVVATIPSGQSTLVTLPTGTKITFDGAFVLENGTAYNGNVNISMNYLSPTDPNVFVKMPGSLLGERTDGSISGMETYGMVNVEMYGTNNEKLQLEPGHTANISMPIASNQLDTAAATIPLWYFNETTGLWQEQGFSRKIGNRYIGNVSHFTWWNNDSAYVVATLHVTVKNADGTFVQGVRVTITRQNGSTGDVLMDLGVTGANGQLSAGVPRNEVLTFKAYTSDGQLINTQVLPASSELNRYVTIIIPVLNKN
jgi:hypothetical protein